MAKLSAAGTHVWSKRFGGTGVDIAYAVTTDGSSNILMTGYFGYFGSAVDFGGGLLASAGNSDVFLVKLASTGAHVWSKGFGGTGLDMGYALATNRTTGDVAVTGYFQNTAGFGGANITSAGNADIFLAEYSAAGAHMWSKGLGGASDDHGRGIVIDSLGDVVMTGDFYGNVDFGGGILPNTGGADIVLAKYGSTGTHVWSRRFGTGLGFGDVASGLAVDAGDNLVLTGSILGAIDFGGGGLTANGSYDIFLAKLAPNASHLWSRRYGKLYDDHGNAVAVDRAGRISLVGDFYQGVDFGGGLLSSPGNTDACVAEFGP